MVSLMLLKRQLYKMDNPELFLKSLNYTSNCTYSDLGYYIGFFNNSYLLFIHTSNTPSNKIKLLKFNFGGLHKYDISYFPTKDEFGFITNTLNFEIDDSMNLVHLKMDKNKLYTDHYTSYFKPQYGGHIMLLNRIYE